MSSPRKKIGMERRDSVLFNSEFVDPNYLPKVLRGLEICEADEDDTHSEGVPDDGEVHLAPHTLEKVCPGIGIDMDIFSRVLVLYTGGTIGMKNINGVGLAPVPNYLGLVLRTLPMFHDKEYADELGITNDLNNPLILPYSKEKKRLIYTVLEYDPVLDSCNMTMTDWARLAKDIKKHYDYYDGFLILHGTDTMAYTASALSFMIENLGKPVIITGSQIPLYDTRSDGLDNFLGALTIAGYYNIPEVCVCFNHKLMRGNRTVKVDSSGFDAFHSPNLPPLALLEIDISVSWNSIFKPVSLQRMEISTHLCPYVGLLRFFPSITVQTVRQFLQPPMQGIVLQTYGAGNGPDSNKELLQLFKEASDRGVLMINITQCTKGKVSALYAAGQAMLKVGIIPGSDMTPEAALTKLAYVLCKDEWSLEKKRKMLGVNLRGEMKVLEEETSDSTVKDLPLITKIKQCMQISSQEEVEMLRNNVYPPLICSAAKEGDVGALSKLVEAGCVFTTADYDGRTPLHVASSEGHLDAVRFLLEHGALVHYRDRYGITPLDDAIQFNHHEIIQLLIQTGANLITIPQRLGIELCLAAARDDINKLESYQLAGANLNQGDYDNRTALHVAIYHGHLDCVLYLLSQGASVTAKDRFGHTAVDEADRCNRIHIQKILKQHLESPNKDNYNSHCVLTNGTVN